jgi:hypothetical protein
MQKQEPIEFPYNTDIIRSIVGGYPEPTSFEELHQVALSRLPFWSGKLRSAPWSIRNLTSKLSPS